MHHARDVSTRLSDTRIKVTYHARESKLRQRLMKERPLLKEAPMHTEQETYQSDLPRTRIKVNYPKIKVADHTQEVSKRLKRETYERETPFHRGSLSCLVYIWGGYG